MALFAFPPTPFSDTASVEFECSSAWFGVALKNRNIHGFSKETQPKPNQDPTDCTNYKQIIFKNTILIIK